MDRGATVIGAVRAIAVKTARGGPMRKIAEAEAVVDGGIVGAPTPAPHRGITLIASGQWAEAMRELSASLPWHTRRANVLIDAATLAPLIGRRVTLGGIVLEIGGETRPCELMNEFLPGLLDALKPACRAGVYGRVVQAGRLRVGDELSLA